MASKRILLYATDAYKLSSLLLRRVVLTKPVTLEAYREKSRQLLLDQSSPSSVNANVAAVKMLELDREWNLMQYYGAPEYAKRWWASTSWSSSLTTNTNTGGGSNQPDRIKHTKNEATNTTGKNKNVARVAFMITSGQRHNLTTKLGYTPQDIRTFKPVEALLLLEHGVQKEMDDDAVEYDFRAKLKQLVEENEQLTQMENEKQQSMQNAEPAVKETVQAKVPTESTIQQSISSDKAQQIHAKPDVAMALLSVDEDVTSRGDHTVQQSLEKMVADSATKPDSAPKSSTTGITESRGKVGPETVDSNQSALAIVDVTPIESEELHMKPDVAAAILSSQHQEGQQQKQQILDDRENEEAEDHGPCWYEVVESLPTTKPPVLNKGENENTQLISDPSREHVIALFPTKKEALECVRIKQSFRRKAHNEGEGNREDRFLVRRRLNA